MAIRSRPFPPNRKRGGGFAGGNRRPASGRIDDSLSRAGMAVSQGVWPRIVGPAGLAGKTEPADLTLGQ
jgi:hypothetical protein